VVETCLKGKAVKLIISLEEISKEESDSDALNIHCSMN
jgi:hypothetical protein